MASTADDQAATGWRAALPEGVRLPPGTVAQFKKNAFRAILAEERERLTTIPELFETLEKEIG